MVTEQGDLKKRLAGLIDSLDLLVAQTRAYDRSLPRDNYVARAAVASLAKLAQQALNEAQDVADQLDPPPAAAHPFSPRELEVLQLIAEGLSNQEIAARLILSLNTVKGHTRKIYGKLGVNSRTQAVAKAQALGIHLPS